jgi:hypothetical protein
MSKSGGAGDGPAAASLPARSGGARKKAGFAHLPVVTLSAKRATRKHVVTPNAQQRFELAIDADVDVPPGARTNEMQPFHAGLRDQLAPNRSSLHYRA